MNPQEFRFLSELLKKRSGLALNEDKGYLLDSRLKSVARSHGHEDVSALVRYMQTNIVNEDLLREITEAMTTNESMFFRDNKPFDSLRNILLPSMRRHLNTKLRVWCAACSNGQEPYSMALTLMENPGLLQGLDDSITATDIDTQVLKKAEQGIYTQFEVQRGLPITILLKYFDQRDNNNWQAKQELRRKVKFESFNLLSSYSGMGKFDVIMCRNVLIYFDEKTKRDVLERLCECMHSHSLLFLGSAETVMGITDKLKPLNGYPGIFTLTNSTLDIIDN